MAITNNSFNAAKKTKAKPSKATRSVVNGKGVDVVVATEKVDLAKNNIAPNINRSKIIIDTSKNTKEKSKKNLKPSVKKSESLVLDDVKIEENSLDNLSFDDILSYVKGGKKISKPSNNIDTQNFIEEKKPELFPTSLPVSNLSAESIIINSAVTKPKKYSLFRRLAIFIILICFLLVGSGTYLIRQVNSFADGVFDGSNSGDILQVLTTGFTSTPQPIAGASEGRTNILLVGKDTAAGLTDSIMIASIFHKEKTIATVNIPRDFWVRHPQLGGSKINALYPYAESYFGEGTGASKLAEFLSGELQIPVHYWAIVNFQGLEDVVNEIGGIDVNVDKAFTDFQYPNDNYNGYMRPAPSFKAGVQPMNGRTALIYSRSRYAGADEGDFSRSRRQSIIVEAILSKLSNQMKSGDMTLNPNKIAAYLQVFGSNVRTSIKIAEIPSFYATFKDLEITGNFHRLVWRNGNGFLCAALDTRGSVVTYCDGTEPTGANRSGSSKKLARESVQNLLAKAIAQEQQNSP